jgi:nucleotide-binding universal stress UspA family protein
VRAFVKPMTTQGTPTRSPVVAAPSVFDRILVGVDGTKESLDACRQAALLAESNATVEAAIVSAFPPAAAAALGVRDLARRLERTAGSSLSAAAGILGPHAELRRLEGVAVETLLREATRVRATLLAIGPPAHARIEEIVIGGTGGELLHLAPCSVLLARPVPNEETFPRSIVVGIDGSQQAARAYEVAERLAGRFHSDFRGVAAVGGKHVDLDEIQSRHSRVDEAVERPVPALLEAASCADLLVVGSRGLHGIRALGSVSERVAHGAACSVLVVR